MKNLLESCQDVWRLLVLHVTPKEYPDPVFMLVKW